MTGLVRSVIAIGMVLAFAGAIQVASADPAGVQNGMREEIEQLRSSGRLSVRGIEVASGAVLAEFYERRNFRQAWTSPGSIDSLLEAIEMSAGQGFTPTDYHVNQVREARAAIDADLTDRQRAVIDILYTDSLFRLGYHYRYGKVNPYTLDPQWNFTRERESRDVMSLMEQAIEAAHVEQSLRELYPSGPMYERVRTALARYQDLAATGGWSQTPDGATLKPGASDPRLGQIAARLKSTGDLASSNATFSTYDDTLVQAVRRFQYRHALDDDGVIGPATLAALNQSIETKIDRLRLTLERARWLTGSLTPNLMVVNIAGFGAYLYEDDEIVWETRVQVGRTYHKTPVFMDEMKYVVLNPTWVVPYSIATREMLPKIKSQPDYFETRDFDIKNKDGNLVDHRDVDWNALGRGNFGYTFVQRAGPNNALGLAKFIFPNEHAVYLHDTPSKILFEKAERAFSHGCIRVDRPLELAEILLRDKGWDRARIDANTETETVFLTDPLPVLIMYWTAEVTPDGTVRFFDDIYERDARVLEGLNAPFMLDRPQE